VSSEWWPIAGSANGGLEAGVNAARRELNSLQVEAALQRLDQVRQHAPTLGIDRGLGLSL
jgi:hypothetical protein